MLPALAAAPPPPHTHTPHAHRAPRRRCAFFLILTIDAARMPRCGAWVRMYTWGAGGGGAGCGGQPCRPSGQPVSHPSAHCAERVGACGDPGKTGLATQARASQRRCTCAAARVPPLWLFKRARKAQVAPMRVRTPMTCTMHLSAPVCVLVVMVSVPVCTSVPCLVLPCCRGTLCPAFCHVWGWSVSCAVLWRAWLCSPWWWWMGGGVVRVRVIVV